MKDWSAMGVCLGGPGPVTCLWASSMFCLPVKQQDLRWNCKGPLLTTSQGAQETEGLVGYRPFEERDERAPSAFSVSCGHQKAMDAMPLLTQTKPSEELSSELPKRLKKI